MWRSRITTVVRALVDLVVVVACIASILHWARRRTVDCRWEHLRASCAVEVEDSLGRVERDAFGGIRDAAYRSGSVVGLVTDTENKGEHALFGTHEIELSSNAEAVRLQSFASDREPEHVSIASGVAHPRWLTGGLLCGLLAYGVVTRRRRPPSRRARA